MRQVGRLVGARLSRRALVRSGFGLGFAAAAGVLAACSSTPPTAAPTAAPAAAPTTAPAATAAAAAKPTPAAAGAAGSKPAVTLRFLDLAVASWKPVHHAILDEYEAKNPNVKTDRQAIPFAEYIPKLQAEFVAGDAPDIHFNIGGEILKFAKDGHLLNLEPYARSGDLKPSDQYDELDVVPFRYPLLKGDLYALGVGNVLTFVGYNKRLFDEAKLPPPSNLTWDPKTGGTLLETAQKLTKKDSSGNITQWGFSWYGHVGALGVFVWSNGGEVLATDQTSAKPLTEQPVAEAVDFLSDLVNKHQVAYFPGMGIGSQAAIDAWTPGKLAMTITHSWGGWMAIKDFEWDIVPVPTGPKGQVPYGGADHYSAWSKTKYKDETFQTFKYFTGPEAQAKRFDLWPAPTYKALTESKEFVQKAPPPQNRAMISGQLAKAKQFYFVPPWSAWTNELLQEVGLVYRKQKATKDALASAQKKIDDLLKANPM